MKLLTVLALVLSRTCVRPQLLRLGTPTVWFLEAYTTGQ